MCKRRFNPDQAIAMLLIRGQNASNGGKGIAPFNTTEKVIADNQRGYNLKVSCLKEAVKLIDEHPTSSFTYTINPDKYRHAKYLVYFEAVFDGRNHQVIFHSNCPDLKSRVTTKPVNRNRHYRSCDEVETVYRHFVPTGTYL